MKIYPHCTSKEFKTDLNQLCDHCPLKDKIQKGIQDQSRKIFDKYLVEEVDNAQKAMTKMFLLEQSQQKEYNNPEKDPYRKNRIEVYIWNKERIKALNGIIVNIKPSIYKRLFEKIFKR